MNEEKGNIKFRREIYINKIYVLESLNKHDKKTGKSLFDDLIRWKTESNNLINSEYLEIESKDKLMNKLDEISDNTYARNEFPILHLEIHGNKDGLVLNSGEFISWEELYPKLKSINIGCRNNLFITLAVCYGSKIQRIINPTQRSPYYGFLAPKNKNTEDEIETNFLNYYTVLLNSFNLKLAIEALNQNGESEEYVHYNSELLFNMFYEQFEKDNEDGNSIFEYRVNELMAQVLLDKRFSKLEDKLAVRNIIKKNLLESKDMIKMKSKSHFLMEDLKK